MDLLQKIKALPSSYSEVNYGGKRYSVSRTDYNDQKSIKIYAKELGGTRFISFNYYLTNKSELLKPCEMPEMVVIHFLENYHLIRNQVE